MSSYRGRLAPSPTGYLHLGHAGTFWIAQGRARQANGRLILRIEDIDSARCRAEFRAAAFEDLRWLGFEWDEGPDVGGAHSPYVQSERLHLYRGALETLRRNGFVYPCVCSRKDVINSASAPHEESGEPIYPGTCRQRSTYSSLGQVSWRFRVPDGEQLSFTDGRLGERTAICGRHFGDFIVWRRDDMPSYQLAVVVDDAVMQISEVVRGEDLVTSTFRQLLLYRALDEMPPQFYHTALVVDRAGQRLAKRHESLSVRALRQSGRSPADVREMFPR